MDCEKAKQLLHPYLDNLLHRTEKEGLQSHLFRCSECRTELLRLEWALLVMEELGVTKAPSGFTDSVMAQVRKEAGSRKRVVVLSHAALLAFILLSISMVYRSGASFVENLSQEQILNLGFADGGYDIIDGFLAALGHLEAGLVLGLCLVFVSSAIFVMSLIGHLPLRPTYYSTR